MSMRGGQSVDSPALLSGCQDFAILHQLSEGAADSFGMDFTADAPLDVHPARIGKPLEVFKD
jgi:hypothetical protein